MRIRVERAPAPYINAAGRSVGVCVCVCVLFLGSWSQSLQNDLAYATAGLSLHRLMAQDMFYC